MKPKLHDFVTISTCKTTRDRSYAGDVWEVIAANDTHIQIVSLTKEGFFRGPHILQIHEYDFTDAKDFLTKLEIVKS